MTTNARASLLRLRAPDGCAQASDISDQVDTLLGRPLASVAGVDFEVDIAPAEGGRWRLRLDRVARVEKRTRELVGTSCRELVDAAAVAIAMSIRSGAPPDEGAAPARASDPAAPPAPVPTPVPPAGAGASSPDGSLGRRADPVRVSAALTLAAVGDVGALPGPAPGGALEVALHVGRLQLIGLGALFTSRTARVGSVGGDFGLAFGAALVCYTQGLGRVTALGCAGAELGRLSGEGVGVDRPHLGSALWLAPRADVGIGIPMTASLTLILRGGAAFPRSRPVFIANESVPVHRAGPVSGRVTLGIEVDF